MPSASIDRAISPPHLTKSLSFVVNITAAVGVAALPFEVAPAVFLIHIVISLIVVGATTLNFCFFLPFSVSMLKAVFKGALVSVAIDPFVLTVTFRFTV